MTAQPLGSPILVYSRKTLAQMLVHLQDQPLIALDTESDSLYSYHAKVCLIQITARTSAKGGADPAAVVDYLVDPLRLDDLAPLGALLKSPDVEVVMHAAENDMILLYRAFGFTFSRVFDTQLAARILGRKHVGLASMLEDEFGVVTDKRMQRTNWGKRPLAPQQIAYAQMDTHYLLSLREHLIAELRAKGRWEEALDAFAVLSRVDYSHRQTEERTFWHMKDVRSVPIERTNVLETLWCWREEEARRQDRPPFKVVNDAVLVQLTLNLPTSFAALRTINGLSESQIQRYGEDIVRNVREGQSCPLPKAPFLEQRTESTLEKTTLQRYDILRKWRSEKAKAREVAPDIVLTNSTILDIAIRNPHTQADLLSIPDIGEWKAKTYGAEILAAIAPLERSANGHVE